MNKSNEPITQAFGQKIRATRKSFGWSQEALAHRAGLNRSYLGQIERGETLVSIVTIEKLARAFRQSLSILLSELPEKDLSDSPETAEAASSLHNCPPVYGIRYLSIPEHE
ncbi:MAG TPA: helix-turn-helix transcriptional regulator [Cellvibrionaceae bacterium]